MSYHKKLYSALESMRHHANLKNSSNFNQVLYDNYKNSFSHYRYTWNFCAAFFCWKKMRHYQNEVYRCKVQEMIKEINKQSHVTITLTA